MTVQLGDLVSVNGIRCRVRLATPTHILLIPLDPLPAAERLRLREPVVISDLDAPEPAAGSCFTTNSVAVNPAEFD